VRNEQFETCCLRLALESIGMRRLQTAASPLAFPELLKLERRNALNGKVLYGTAKFDGVQTVAKDARCLRRAEPSRQCKHLTVAFAELWHDFKIQYKARCGRLHQINDHAAQVS